MSVKDKVKARITECMKSKKGFERDILRTVLGEIQAMEAKQGEVTDEQCEKIFTKFKQGVKDNMLILQDLPRHEWDPVMIAKMEKEVAIYEGFIPETMGVEEIVGFLSNHSDAIEGANSDGQATGMAMKIIKVEGLRVDGKDVSMAVKSIRSNNE